MFIIFFPRRYLIDSGITEKNRYNQIANFTYLDTTVNKLICDDAPTSKKAVLKNTAFFTSGEAGIRTLGPQKRSTVFETAPFDRSGTSPDFQLVTKISLGQIECKDTTFFGNRKKSCIFAL